MRLSVGAKAVLQGRRADVAELVDARDLKSLDGNVVRVRFPPSAPVNLFWISRSMPGFGISERFKGVLHV